MKYTNRHLPNITKYIDGSQSGFIFKTSNKSGSLVFKNDDFIFGLQDGTEINLRSLSSADPNTTLQGNTFNGVEQLVQTDTDGVIPESVLPTTVTLAGNEFNGANQLLQLNESGLIEDSNLSSNVTLQGNTFNGANQLCQLDGTGDVPIENLPSSVLNGGTTQDTNGALHLTDQGSTSANNLGTGAIDLQYNRTSTLFQSTGYYSFTAGGFSVSASGYGAVALGGFQSYSTGDYAFTTGTGNQSIGNNSFTTGRNTIARTFGETVVGVHSEDISGDATDITSGDPAFRVGVGLTDTSERDGFRVNKGGGVMMEWLKSGADQTAAGASTGELWYTDSHATLPDGVLMMGL